MTSDNRYSLYKIIIKTTIKAVIAFCALILSLLIVLFIYEIVEEGVYLPGSLGKGYRISEIEKGVSIIYHRNNILDKSKQIVIQEAIRSCGWNRHWVVVKTRESHYYVIDKEKEYILYDPEEAVMGPLDSISFYKLDSGHLPHIHFPELLIVRQYDR